MSFWRGDGFRILLWFGFPRLSRGCRRSYYFPRVAKKPRKEDKRDLKKVLSQVFGRTQYALLGMLTFKYLSRHLSQLLSLDSCLTWYQVSPPGVMLARWTGIELGKAFVFSTFLFVKAVDWKVSFSIQILTILPDFAVWWLLILSLQNSGTSSWYLLENGRRPLLRGAEAQVVTLTQARDLERCSARLDCSLCIPPKNRDSSLLKALASGWEHS